VERVILAAAVVALAALIAVLVERRRPAAPTQAQWTVPAQLDRDDFDGPEVPWLVAVFTSATCETCAVARDKAAVLASTDVVVQEVEVMARRDLHDRYGIDAVPTILVADRAGVVRKSFLGPPTATDLWAAVARARESEREADSG
jgi:hypothetical protein